MKQPPEKDEKKTNDRITSRFVQDEINLNQ